jgi:RsiW-degrading membrane proteinase PrsW (M82 family)
MDGLNLIIGFLCSLLPAFIWLALFLREDKTRPEPKSFIFKSFLWGALIALPVVFVNEGFNSIVDKGFITLVLFAGVEEFFKFSAALFSVRRNPNFDEPIDAMIYAIAAGLGFATIENLLSVMGQVGQGEWLTGALEVLVLRFIGATLLHTLTAGLIGYYWAQGIKTGKKLFFITWGFLVAWMVHTFFNWLMYVGGGDFGIFYPTLFLLGSSFFVLQDFEKLKN